MPDTVSKWPIWNIMAWFWKIFRFLCIIKSNRMKIISNYISIFKLIWESIDQQSCCLNASNKGMPYFLVDGYQHLKRVVLQLKSRHDGTKMSSLPLLKYNNMFRRRSNNSSAKNESRWRQIGRQLTDYIKIGVKM